MKNQKKKAPKRHPEGMWNYRYEGPHKTHHVDDINEAKTAHRKKKNKKGRVK